MLAVAVLLAVGCSAEGGAGSVGASTSTAAPTTFPPHIEAACRAYQGLWAALPADASDAEHAARLDDLAAGEAAGTRLEPLLTEMAEALRCGDASIPDTVTTVCAGRTPTTLSPEELDRETEYLHTVRAAAPDISDSDSDLVTAIDLACDGLDLAAATGELPTNGDQLMALAWPPLSDMADAEHVLRAGVPLYCPQHTELVERLL